MKISSSWLVLVALAVMQHASTRAYALDIDCENRRECTDSDPQVCASDGITYVNRCTFEYTYCAEPSPKLFIVYESACKTKAPTPAPTTTTDVDVPTPAPTTMTYDVDVPTPALTTMTYEAPVPTPTPAPTTTYGATVVDSTEPFSDYSQQPSSAASAGIDTSSHGESGGTESLTNVEGPARAADLTQPPTPTPAPTVPTSPPSRSGSGSGSSTAETNQLNCQIKCPNDWIPVCGSDDETYANECYRLAAKCNNPRLVTAHRGECVRTPAPFVPSTATPTPAPTTTLEVTASGSVRPLKCNPVCEKIYAPVCGSDDRTYANQCLLDFATCNDPRVMRVSFGKCPPRVNDVVTAGAACVPAICSSVEDAVCASDGVTYDNDCFFRNAQCMTPQLRLVHDGACNADTAFTCATLTCPPYTECREVGNGNSDGDDDATANAFCADVCAPERCSAGETCQLLDSECFTAPCSPVATCVALDLERENERENERDYDVERY